MLPKLVDAKVDAKVDARWKRAQGLAETAKTMGTEILDHIIIAGDNAFDFKERGLIWKNIFMNRKEKK